MKPIIGDVFSTRDFNFDDIMPSIGNLYVKGDAEFSKANKPVEIFGDVIIEGELSANNIIIHGNLQCKSLYCNFLTVDGDIFISKSTDAIVITSNEGNIFLANETVAESIAALEGSIFLGYSSDIDKIKAFDTICIEGDVTNVSTIVAGSGIVSKGIIELPLYNERPIDDDGITLSVLSGGVTSKNINIK